MRERGPSDHDEARLLPHLRDHSLLLDRRRMERAQAAALDAVLADEPDGKPLPLREALTKLGDPQALSGVPVQVIIGGEPTVSFQRNEFRPEREVIRRLMRQAA